MTKKVLAVLLAVCLFVSALPLTVSAADSDFTIENGVLIKYNGLGGDVTIPDGVTSIRELAFSFCHGVTSVNIPHSVISIDEDAFFACAGLADINVASGNPEYVSVDGVLYTKDMSTLLICPHGKQGRFIIPAGVTNISERAFFHCSGLTGITIPISVTSIGWCAFAFCSSLSAVYYAGTEEQWNQIDISDDNEPLKDALRHYNGTEISDTDIVASGSCGTMITKARWSLDKNGTLTINGTGATCDGGPGPSYVPWLKEYADDVKKVVIQNGITKIAAYSFSGCANLSSVLIPDSVTEIGSAAFVKCSALQNVTIPANMTSIDTSAFILCAGLTRIDVALNNTTFVSVNGAL